MKMTGDGVDGSRDVFSSLLISADTTFSLPPLSCAPIPSLSTTSPSLLFSSPLLTSNFIVETFIPFDSDIHVQNLLIRFFGFCGFVEFALKMFKEMPHRDLVSWSSIISCLVNNGFAFQSLDTFWQMQVNGHIKLSPKQDLGSHF
ncbi:Pentatricopeptide repeat [Dillenia turbinata]|uniref:Pentatricopeptide repeat n=1 Tax=Dillenia turbinata TaxID=194707 RepID=A0AAN8VA07_9MAGN